MVGYVRTVFSYNVYIDRRPHNGCSVLERVHNVYVDKYTHTNTYPNTHAHTYILYKYERTCNIVIPTINFYRPVYKQDERERYLYFPLTVQFDPLLPPYVMYPRLSASLIVRIPFVHILLRILLGVSPPLRERLHPHDLADTCRRATQVLYCLDAVFFLYVHNNIVRVYNKCDVLRCPRPIRTPCTSGRKEICAFLPTDGNTESRESNRHWTMFAFDFGTIALCCTR